jgi:pimeloyl-ACP methyl ester carboxylesterase
VFVHGLCETEDAWAPSGRRQGKHDAFRFGDRLVDLGFTPLYVRYNSGLHITDNGARLSLLLQQLSAAWPTPIAEIALIGHSMGGLVARSACHHGHVDDVDWVKHTRHVFGLGTPHLGAPMERGVNAVAWSLRQVPETRGLARVLNARSVGIKDLRFGSLLEDDWTGQDIDGFLTGRAAEVPFLRHVAYYFIGATVTRDRHHPLGWLVGDLLVQFSSASGHSRRRRLPFDIDNGHHIGGLNHFDLLSHPDVHAQLELWLSASVPATHPSGDRTTPAPAPAPELRAFLTAADATTGTPGAATQR